MYAQTCIQVKLRTFCPLYNA